MRREVDRASEEEEIGNAPKLPRQQGTTRSGGGGGGPPAPLDLPVLLTKPRHVLRELSVLVRDLRSGTIDAGSCNAAVNAMRLALECMTEHEVVRKLDKAHQDVDAATRLARAVQ